MLPTFRGLLFLGLTAFGGSIVFASACRGAEEAALPQPPYTNTATIKDIMLGIVDPSADVVWNAVGTIVDPKGADERKPRADEDWEAVRYAALRLAEATNLLMVPGRKMARPGEKSVAPGVELEPEEMEALVQKDLQGWYMRANALHDVAIEALKAADAKDPEQLFEVGYHIEMACESCHRQYWYPNEKLPPGYGEPTPPAKP